MFNNLVQWFIKNDTPIDVIRKTFNVLQEIQSSILNIEAEECCTISFKGKSFVVFSKYNNYWENIKLLETNIPLFKDELVLEIMEMLFYARYELSHLQQLHGELIDALLSLPHLTKQNLYNLFADVVKLNGVIRPDIYNVLSCKCVMDTFTFNTDFDVVHNKNILDWNITTAQQVINIFKNRDMIKVLIEE